MTEIAVIVFACAAFAADPNKVLRVAASDIDTLDPQQYNDNPSFADILDLLEVSRHRSRSAEVDRYRSITLPRTAMLLPYTR